MPFSSAQRTHIDKHRQAYDEAYDCAMVACKADARFTGLTKTRAAIAHEAALDASGFKPSPRPLIVPDNAGRPTVEFQRMCEELLSQAREAAYLKILRVA